MESSTGSWHLPLRYLSCEATALHFSPRCVVSRYMCDPRRPEAFVMHMTQQPKSSQTPII
eukprot:6180485-Pleurochrysis_carterae.AAC.1